MKHLTATLLFISFAFWGMSQSSNTGGIPAGLRNIERYYWPFCKSWKRSRLSRRFTSMKNLLMTHLKGDVVFKDLPKRTKKFGQTAMVQFIVCTDGSVCDVKVINNVLPSIKKRSRKSHRQLRQIDSCWARWQKSKSIQSTADNFQSFRLRIFIGDGAQEVNLCKCT